MRILLIEDNAELAEAISEYFSHIGHPLDWCASAEAAEQLLGYQPFDLLVLDINLPGKSGFQFLQSLRARGKVVPILVLTARAEVDDRVSALDLGADDYMVKPFHFRELVARCRALLRRERGGATNQLVCGNLIYDAASGAVTLNHQPVELRHREIQLLDLFLHNFDRILTKEQIADRLYRFDESYTPNAVEQILTRLRRKLVDSSLRIKTIRGLGYLAHVDD